jgi:hypothetical protein
VRSNIIPPDSPLRPPNPMSSKVFVLKSTVSV